MSGTLYIFSFVVASDVLYWNVNDKMALYSRFPCYILPLWQQIACAFEDRSPRWPPTQETFVNLVSYLRNILTSSYTLTTSPCCLSLLFCQHLKEKSILPLISKQWEPFLVFVSISSFWFTYVLVFIFCLFVLSKPFSDSLFCLAQKGLLTLWIWLVS
jgi:hypothetical protein